MFGCSRKGDESIINLPWPGSDSLTGSTKQRNAQMPGLVALAIIVKAFRLKYLPAPSFHPYA